jgi:hypothetical protein
MILKDLTNWLLDRMTEVFRKYVINNGPRETELMERARADVERLDLDVNLQGIPLSSIHCAIFEAQNDYVLDDELWKEVQSFEFPIENGTVKIGKAAVLKNIGSPLRSYKFYLRVPNNEEQIERGRKLLLDNRLIVTGFGDLEQNKQFHRIWFLSPLGHLHPKQTRLDLANHSVTNISDADFK